MKKLLSALSGLILLGAGILGCTASDPMIDDIYTQNIYLGESSIERELDDGSGGYWHVCDFDASLLSAAGATLLNPNISTLGGYRLDNITECLYFTTHVKDNWDGVSLPIVEISFEVNVDNTGGLDTDTVRIGVECWHKILGELRNTVVSLEGNTVVGKSDQHELFIQSVTLNATRIDEVISFRLNLNTISSEVDSIIVNYVKFKYKSNTSTVEAS